MLAFAPVVALIGQQGLVLLPLVVLPLLGVDYSARIAARSEHASLHDALTGLPNRVLFRRRVEEALARTARSGGEVILMVLDLDRFKEVNDTLGHGRGDELLRDISERLRAAVREVDVVARLGGDEFGVVLVPEAPAAEAALALARRIEDALDAPFELADLWVEGNASIGIACAPEHAADAETLIQRADVAMYQAKQTGGGHAVYDPESDPHLPGKLRLLQDLRPAIDEGQLLLHFQPKVRVADGALEGVEALVRWQHPARGLLYPADFIELAERSNVVRALTLRVVRDAVRQAAHWHEMGLELPVAVNLSPRVLLDVALPADIAAILEEEALPPRLLEVEITESCLIADPDRTAGILERLSETGVRISIDDFGTGYSSLSLLKRLPVDAIKIDRSFVGDLAHDANDMAIVESTIQLAASLGVVAVAEGVETPEAWQRLVEFGCDLAQGFYVSRPLPAAELEAWLAARVGV
jgi:diguanylate cyclase (GGDEF)-like protein